MKQLPCELEECGQLHPVKRVGGLWKPVYCPDCVRLKVWAGKRNIQRRLKELDGEK